MTYTEEIHALDQLSDRLQGRFPEAPKDQIRNVVRQLHHEYDGSPIRDFIPVLVEREAVDRLRTGGVTRHNTVLSGPGATVHPLFNFTAQDSPDARPETDPWTPANRAPR